MTAPTSRLVVDNPIFLILPWIMIPNLAPHILAIVGWRLPQDWAERYNTTPVLIDTFVETQRYTGHVGLPRVGVSEKSGPDQTSRTVRPASCSNRTPTICSSVDRFRFIVSCPDFRLSKDFFPPQCPGSHGEGQSGLDMHILGAA